MEVDLRVVLVGVGIFVIGCILFDGFRRMRRSRMGEIGLPLEMGGSCDAEVYYNGELPNGGARRTRFFDGEDLNDDVRPPERVEPSFGNAVDNTEAADELAADLGDVATHADDVGRVRRQSLDMQESEYEEAFSEKNESASATSRPNENDLFEDDDMLLAMRAAEQEKLDTHYHGTERGSERDTEDQQNSSNKRTSKNSSSRDSHLESERISVNSQSVSQEKSSAEEEMPINVGGLEEVIVLNLMAKPGEYFDGIDLDKALTSCGFRFGDMNIYHRYEQHVGRGSLLFSIANVVEPGTFDPENLDQFTTPGVCVFMKLPGPKRSVHSFELMVECCRKVVTLLDGDMKDEHHSVMTQQTVEHYRQRVLDFDRKLLSHRIMQKS